MSIKSIPQLVLLLLPFFAKTQMQTSNADSLKLSLKTAPDDSARMIVLYKLATYYLESKRDSSLIYIEQGIAIAAALHQPLWSAQFFLSKGYVIGWQWDFSLKFKLCNEAQAIAENKLNEKNCFIPRDNEFFNMPEKYRLGILADVYMHFSVTYGSSGNMEKSREYCAKAVQLTASIKSYRRMAEANGTFAEFFYQTGKSDSAVIYSKKVLEYEKLSREKFDVGYSYQLIGRVYAQENQKDSARYYYKLALSASEVYNNVASEIYQNIDLARLYAEDPDSVQLYAGLALQLATSLNDPYSVEAAERWLYNGWRKKGNADSALAWLMKASSIKDSLNADRNEKLTQFQHVYFEEQNRLDKQVQQAIATKNKIKMIALLAGSVLLAVLAFIFYRNNREKQKANLILQNQKEQTEITLVQLKETQSQLIQSEKMASLGQLTAGIAHEIQNPLNFVNNFSEINNELIEEANREMENGKSETTKELLNDIYANNEKIVLHGKRAEAIVKGMLEHSRQGTGEKQLTDINALADEYLKLAYNGLRAKDKNFNALLKTDFDTTIGKINIVAQDIGRVLLNLYNNAFYAVREKAASSELQAVSSSVEHSEYQPQVTVNTRKTKDGVEILVQDNGPGIPDAIKDKIFQPFFTTKPTGQGTGLGLSLAYDIITKGHNGTITLISNEGKGTSFVIQLPVK